MYIDIGWQKDCGRQSRLIPQKVLIIHFCFGFPHYSIYKVKISANLLWEETSWDPLLNRMFVEVNKELTS